MTADPAGAEIQRYSAVVVGAGVVGTALALQLAQQGLRVALLERIAPQHRPGRLGFESRTVAISPASRRWLESLNAWPATDACSFTQMRVWDGEGTAELTFSAQDFAPPAERLGDIVEQGVLAHALWQQAQWHARIDVIAPLELSAFDAGQRLLTSVDGRRLGADVIIAADGANSQLRQWCGVEVSDWATDHVAVATIVQTEQPHQHTAWQVFLPTGPLALLPLPVQRGNFCSVVWSCVPALAAELQRLSGHDFAERLAAAFERRLGNVLHADARISVPLTQRHARCYQSGGSVVFVGDSAHVLHPLAGQGVNVGLRDARVLARLLSSSDALQQPDVVGNLLQQYEQKVRMNNSVMLGMTRGLHGVFGSDALWLRGVRNQGMRWLSALPWARRQLAREAMGEGWFSAI